MMQIVLCKFLFSRKTDFSHVYSKVPNKIMEKQFMEGRSLKTDVSTGSELMGSFGETPLVQEMKNKTAIS